MQRGNRLPASVSLVLCALKLLLVKLPCLNIFFFPFPSIFFMLTHFLVSLLEQANIEVKQTVRFS